MLFNSFGVRSQFLYLFVRNDLLFLCSSAERVFAIAARFADQFDGLV